LVTLFIVSSAVSSRKTENTDNQIIHFLGIIGLIAIGVGIINSALFIVPPLILINLFEFGPLVLAIFICILASLISEKFNDKQYLSIMLVILAPDLEMRIFLTITIILMDKVFYYLKYNNIVIKDLFASVVGYSFYVISLEKITPKISSTLSAILFIAIMGFLLSRLVFKYCDKQIQDWQIPTYLLVGTLFFSFVNPNTRAEIDVQPIGDLRDADYQELCDFVKQNTLPDDVFITNPTDKKLQYCSNRSVFVTFKQVPMKLSLFPEWYKRLEILEFLPPGLDSKTINHFVSPQGDNYEKLETKDFERIKEDYGFVDYVITTSEVYLSFPRVFSNESYTLYKINNSLYIES